MMRADEQMRQAVGSVPPGYALADVRTAPAPPLVEATVAIVTSAALAHPGEPWPEGSHDFRLFDRDEDRLVMAHNSTNFDRTGFAADRNVVYPIDRLAEMARSGAIGGVAPRHASLLGSTFELATFELDTAPRLARILRGDGVDIALLTPV
ncbi:MAG: selenoprotein B glycine/betaine/sarcosine/D-proline reductase [Spirochaetaceae bacterium]|nr:hypothetical protein [Myxococcales bacterium]MCB9724661.1 selenoprotein B glycine/betaine/sarcosine/D-proline reductase [Spirochaetaceae bacterium]